MKGPALMLALVAAAACGGGVTMLWMRQPPPSPTASRLPPVAASERARMTPAATPAPPTLAREVAAARDPARLQALMDRYASATEGDERGALLATLGAIGGDEVRRFALSLVARPDTRGRALGLDLLDTFPLDAPGVREAIAAGLDGEADPTLLARYIELTVPTVMPQAQSAPLSASLRRLATHEDPEVRARGVVQAAQWAATDDDAEALLGRALLDTSPRVRSAAVAGVIATRSRSEQIRDALLWLVADAETSDEDRSAALFALQWYQLSAADYAIYRAASERIAADDH